MFKMLRFKWIKMEGKIQKIGGNLGFSFLPMNCQNSKNAFFFYTTKVDF
jgi:hypothetical protein